ncbi:unnamed protein product [Prunus armeniaca]
MKQHGNGAVGLEEIGTTTIVLGVRASPAVSPARGWGGEGVPADSPGPGEVWDPQTRAGPKATSA